MHARRHSTSVCTFAMAVLLAGASAGQAVEKGGVAIAVVQATSAAGAAGDRTLTVDAPVFMGDVIRTGSSGEAQIRLLDDTRLVVGPNSYMTVDEFILEGDNKARKVTLNAVRGAFRFITGASRKDAYTIKTPTATIGVRGTRFDFSVMRRGEMNLALFEGEANICDRRQQCVVVSGACSIAVAQRFRPIRPPSSADERGKLLATAFPFVVSQVQLQRGFRVDTSDCTVQRANIELRDAEGRPVRAAGVASDGSSGPSGFTSFSSTGPASTSSPGQGNNGFGNGGEGSEGSTETGNPGGGGGGNGNGNGNH